MANTAYDNVPVRIDNLPVGVYLECKIYFLKSGELSLLSENQVLDEALIERFRKIISPEINVYIPKKYVAGFFDKGIYLGFNEDEARKIKESGGSATSAETAATVSEKAKLRVVMENHDGIKRETSGLLDDAAKNGRINEKRRAQISEDIQEQLEISDISHIIQSINRIRAADEYLYSHSVNVAFLNGLMGKWLKLDKKRFDELVEIGLLHDVGKLRIPPEIINKPAKLNPDEFEEIKKHPVYSLDMLVKSGVKNRALLTGVVQHHEKVNGTGYPSGLPSDKITEFAKITAISDMYDAMVTKRVYKEPHSPFVILEAFSHEGYSELDITYVKMFIDCMIEELKGKKILLSDGTVATVMLVNPRNLLYPIVEVNGNILATSRDVYCERMYYA
ncbi:MAG: HD-GYP domain-containing protein [Oscillospiraceae bacterium]|jgi:HD-GYP domain-containing protein (c-di-GMP phosphodiesterase class II)|nr:HD-GYP domain-containing protein [Oscillospiraceae bacterium]